MSKFVNTGFSQKPDLGLLKTKKSEYSFLQNIRGRGGLGFKRNGLQTVATYDSSVMGIFDLSNDGDPDSPDLILVITRDGLFTTYTPSEFITTFTFLFSGAQIILQSPNLTWFSVDLDSTLIPFTTEVVAPSASQSMDMLVGTSDLLGYVDGTGTSRLYVEYGFIKAKRYNAVTGEVIFTTDLAFNHGYGPVFMDSDLESWRLSVTNEGILSVASI